MYVVAKEHGTHIWRDFIQSRESIFSCSFNYQLQLPQVKNDRYSTLNNDISNMSNHAAKFYNANNVTSQ